MREVGGFKVRAVVEHCREDAGRVFVMVAGEGTEGFHFTDSFDPDAHHFAGMGSPVFEGKGEVQVPEDERPEEAHEEVVAGIDKIHPALELSDQTGRREPVDIELGAQLGEAGRMELLRFDAGKDFREEADFVGGTFGVT